MKTAVEGSAVGVEPESGNALHDRTLLDGSQFWLRV